MDFETLMKEEVKRLYRLESRCASVLELLTGKTQNVDLGDAIGFHRLQTQEHAKRLEIILHKIGADAEEGSSKVAAAMLLEATEILRTLEPGEVADAQIIAIAQRCEHLEIASYSSAIRIAEYLDDGVAATLMAENLKDEMAMDRRLAQMGEAFLRGEVGAF